MLHQHHLSRAHVALCGPWVPLLPPIGPCVPQRPSQGHNVRFLPTLGRLRAYATAASTERDHGVRRPAGLRPSLALELSHPAPAGSPEPQGTSQTLWVLQRSDSFRYGATTMDSGLTLPGAGREDPAGYFAEADPGPAGARRGGGDRDLVAVLEEGAHGAVGQGDGFGAAPAQL